MPGAYLHRSPARLLVAIGDHHTQRSLQVRSPDLDVSPFQVGDRVGMRMSVPVVDTGTDDADERVDRVEERRQGRPSTVMRDDQQFGAQTGSILREEVGLRLHLDVTGDQYPAPAVMDTRHDRGLVQFAACPAVGSSRWRMQDLEMQVTDLGVLAEPGGAYRDASCLRDLEHLLHLRDLGRNRVEPHGVDPDGTQDLGDTADVVEVRMGHEDQVEVASTVRPQPTGSRVVFSGIDQDASGRRLDQERISLADIDRRHSEVTRSQTSHDDRETDGDQTGDHDADRPPRGAGSPGGEHPRTTADERHHGGRSSEFGGTTHAGEGVCGPQHHLCGQPGRREQRCTELEMDQGQHRPGEGQHGRDRSGRHRHDVGRDGRHRDLTERGEQQGNDRHLRADRDGDDVGQSSRQTRETLPDERRDDEHPGRCGRGEQEPERPSETGIDQHQQQDGAGQCVTCISGDAARSDQQDQQRHAAGAQHAGLEPGEEGEPDHGERDRATTPHRREPQHRDDEQDAPDEDRDVRTGDRGQVGQSRGTHGLGIVVGQQACVAGHEANQQSTGAVRQVSGGCGPDPLADMFAGCGEVAGIAPRVPRHDVQKDRGVLAGKPASVAAIRERAGRDACIPPAPERRGRIIERDGGTFAGRLAADLVDPDEHTPARRDGTGFLDDDGPNVTDASLACQLRQQTVGHGGDPQHRPDGAHAQDQDHTDHTGRAAGGP